MKLPIITAFTLLANAVIPKNASAEQRVTCKRFFYAGVAWFYLETIKPQSDENMEQFLKEIHNELERNGFFSGLPKISQDSVNNDDGRDKVN